MVAPKSAASALSYALSSPILNKLSGERLLSPEEARTGVVGLDSSGEIKPLKKDQRVLRAVVTVRVTGEVGDGEEKRQAFYAECSFEHNAQFKERAPEEHELGMETTRALLSPLYYVALNRCQEFVWAMGFRGVRLPLNEIKLDRAPDEAPSTATPQRRARRKKPTTP